MNDRAIESLNIAIESYKNMIALHEKGMNECIAEIAELKKADEVKRSVIVTLEITEMMYQSIKHDCGIMKLSIYDGIRKVLMEEFGPE